MPPTPLSFRSCFSALTRSALAAATLALAACASGAQRTEPFAVAPKPALPYTGAAVDAPIHGSNADHVDNLIDLYYRTEWNDTRQGLAKWSQPVTVSLDSPSLQDYRPFLGEYLARLRTEGGVDIRLADQGQGAISVVTASAEKMRRSFATAYCLVIPKRMSFDQLLGSLNSPEKIDWTLVETIDGATVFIPGNASPYQVRACLMEEVAQALGPGNDLFYLADSIFNDDGAHVVPTAFDMLSLRVLYDPSLKAGMTMAEAKPLISDLVDRMNPFGAGVPRGPHYQPAPEWKDAILASSAYGVPVATQLAIAEEAVRLARDFSATDPRRGFSFERLGRAYLSRGQTEKAEFAFRRAIAAYELSVGEQDVRVASARVGLAIALNEQRKSDQALTEIDLALPVLAAHDTEDRITRALKERHDAQAALGHDQEALQTALMGVDWALYTLGADYGELAQSRKDILAVYGGSSN